MRLYELEKGSRIKAETYHKNEDGSKEKLGDFIIFDHVDGMYSYCWVEGRREHIVHLSIGTPLKKVDDYYEIV